MLSRNSFPVQHYSEDTRPRLSSNEHFPEWWRDTERRRKGKPPPEHPRLSDVEYIVGRGQWGHKVEFLLSCIGLSVGLGNIWRFPYQAYAHGGGAFVLAYFILQLLVGKPIYLMEIAIGQFSAKGPTRVWDMNPSAKGIGISMCIVCLIIATYYNVIMVYILYFFFATMQTDLPWTVCEEEWVEKYQCVPFRTKPLKHCTFDTVAMEDLGECTCSGNREIDESLSFMCIPQNENATSAAELYFYKSVIQRSEGIEPENIGTPLWKLSLLLILAWSCVVACILRGVKTSGKVVYVTATFPYLILFVLLIRSLLLDGAVDGVKYFLIPEWSKLIILDNWVAAAGQMFFSLTISLGPIIMYSSYNSFTTPIYSYSLIIATMDFLTSIIGGLVVFATFGAMAKQTGSTVEKVAVSGYGLAFIVYPEALSYMPPSHVWSLLFFSMLFTLGLDSVMGLIEQAVTCIEDEYPKLRAYRVKTVIALASACYLLGLPCVCPGGDYVVTILDHYGAEMCALFISTCEVISVMWVYGVFHFLNDLEYMIGRRPRFWPYWVFCWTLLCPIILSSLNIYSLVTYKAPKYPSGRDFPDFARFIGLGLTCLVLFPIPIWALYLLYSASKPDINVQKENLKSFLFEPNRHWMPNDGRSQPASRMPLAN